MYKSQPTADTPHIHRLFVCVLLWERFPHAKQIPDAAGGGGCIYFLHFTYTHTHTYTLTDSCLPCVYLLNSFFLPWLLFFSPADPTSGAPRRFCFLLPDWVGITHTHTQRLHTLTGSVSLWTHELPVNLAAAQYRPY